MMNYWHENIPLQSTLRFTPLVNDYVQEDAFFKPLIKAFPKPENLAKAIEEKAKQVLDREILVSVLKTQYAHLTQSKLVEQNIQALLNSNTFTVCTAHQPIVFTGPMYVIYKTVHAINLAKSLNRQFPDKHFVPVFYMGTEDHDMDEIGQCYVSGETLVWDSQQSGASGSMKTSNMELLVKAYAKYWNTDLPNEKQWIEVVKLAYNGKNTLAQATQQILHFLFGETGLLVLDADVLSLKKQFIPVMETELFGESSINRLQATLSLLQERYAVQANPRDINLFYLNEAGRNRIERNEDNFKVVGTNLTWNAEQLHQELNAHPERFSPNVILRPLYQETILPNVAFIGGGGELAYWLQLKANFDFFKVPYPILFLRNSLMFVPSFVKQKMTQKGIQWHDIFMELDAWLNTHIHNNELLQEWETYKLKIQENMQSFLGSELELSPDYKASFQAHAAKMNRILDRVSQKTKAFEKRKLQDEKSSFEQIQSHLFPNGTLQERKEHGLMLIKYFGESWLDVLLEVQRPFNNEFTVFGNEPK